MFNGPQGALNALLCTEEKAMKKWKILFGLVAFVFAIDLLTTPFSDDLHRSDFIDLIVTGFSLFPLYGFAYQVAIGSKGIAITIFCFNSLTSLFVIGYGLVKLFLAPAIPVVIVLVIFALFYLVLLYPQFMYAFKSDALWQNNA